MQKEIISSSSYALRILLTGATGFVGKSIAQGLLKNGHYVVSSTRKLAPKHSFQNSLSTNFINWKTVGSIDRNTKWNDALEGINTVIHCAARVHVVREHAQNPLAAYREVNVQGTVQLAWMAAAAGVQRLVFLSTIGVNGNTTVVPFTEDDKPNPRGDYAISKYEAEQELLRVAQLTNMEIVIIRAPLVYGRNAPGNFGWLIRTVQRGIPLPLGAVYNRRSLVALDNLVSLVLLCAVPILSPKAANQVFVVSDGEDVSTTTLLSKIALAANCPNRLFRVPTRLLRAAANVVGASATADRLLENLQVDSTKVRALLGWKPVVNLDEQISSIFT